MGREEIVRKLERDPVTRVVRLDRLLTAALRETLSAYVRGREMEEIPTLRLLRGVQPVGVPVARLGEHEHLPGVGRDAEASA